MAAAAFIVGIVVGASLWQWRVHVRSRRLSRQQKKPAPLLWDFHSVLNAMNKLALASERGRPVEPALVYLLSDYLLHSALIQREDGWADRDLLEHWFLAHVRLLADHRGQAMLPAFTIQMREGVRRIHAHQLLRLLLWILQKATTIHRIQIDVYPPKIEAQTVKVRVEVEGDPTELHKLLEDDRLSAPWQVETGLCTCELRAAFEASPVA